MTTTPGDRDTAGPAVIYDGRRRAAARTTSAAARRSAGHLARLLTLAALSAASSTAHAAKAPTSPQPGDDTLLASQRWVFEHTTSHPLTRDWPMTMTPRTESDTTP